MKKIILTICLLASYSLFADSYRVLGRYDFFDDNLNCGAVVNEDEETIQYSDHLFTPAVSSFGEMHKVNLDSQEIDSEGNLVILSEARSTGFTSYEYVHINIWEKASENFGHIGKVDLITASFGYTPTVQCWVFVNCKTTPEMPACR